MLFLVIFSNNFGDQKITENQVLETNLPGFSNLDVIVKRIILYTMCQHNEMLEERNKIRVFISRKFYKKL